ncbi:MAG: DNA polymerase III subunit alpha [Bacteroidota bacterium]|jgi:DNA polymerase-3 subunit alpha|nr:DNA polymerase III subunit alpha [Bacteroidota bacterium]
MADFIHLHNHSHYSLLDAACTVDDLIAATVEQNLPALALTDHGVMYGAVEFHRKATAAGITPIIGNEMYMVTRGSRFDRNAAETHPEGKRHGYNHLVLLAKNDIGYHNLLKLTTYGHTEGFYYKPRIDWELLRRHAEGLIAMTACAGGVVSTYLAIGDYDAARDVASQLKDIFGDDVYLEIQNHGLERERVIREGMPRLAKELDMKLIATNDIHYVDRNHAVAHNVYLHIADVREAEDIQRLRYETGEYYYKSEREMLDLFKDYPQAIESTVEVMEKIDFRLETGVNHMPEFPIPVDSGVATLDEFMRQLAFEGAERRYKVLTSDILERLDFEIGVISKMGYAGYFLITQDFIQAARQKGIRVGPGRGSAAGSLVAYALGITNVDPLRYDLLFERFLNPERVSMPDIDVDFQDDRREEVIQYTREKYGNDSVAQIITFGRLSARAVIKDVGRVLGIPLNVVESITKHIPVKMGKVQPLTYAFGLKTDPSGKWSAIKELDWVRQSEDPKIRQLVEYSTILEGLNRNVGMHAAGVVIAPSDTSDYVPLYKSPNTEVMTMYNMGDLEEAGLLKMDFLGLITLSVIDRAVKLVRQTRGIEIDIDEIPLDDTTTFDMIGEGHTVGVFQFESSGMRDWLSKLKPRSIDDLAAMNALYRPGPMDFIEDFIDRKFGRKPIEYPHPSMEPILKSTYGIIVFQEQVMKLASSVAGFSLAQADLMRRAMGKKKADVMAQQRQDFVSGAEARGIPRKIASDIFDMIDKFANYGFNKSHSVAYSILAYQTAWLKANYTPEFMAALMTAEMAKTEKVVGLIDECRKLGIEVLPPDVNESLVDFSVGGKQIRFGLAAIKNVGVGAVECIVDARNRGGKFASIFDFTERVNTRAVNKKTMESLVLAGALDSLGGGRASQFAAIESAIAYGVQRQQELEIGQSSLFDDLVDPRSTASTQPSLPRQDEWSDAEMLAREKSVLGFYISGHPLEPWRFEAEAFANVQLGSADSGIDGTAVRACGIIAALRTKIDKRGRTMAFLTLEDFTGKAECLVFADAYERSTAAIAPDRPVILTGKAEVSGDALRIVADEVTAIGTALQTHPLSLIISISTSSATRKQIQDGADILERRRGSGNSPCYFYVSDGNGQTWNLVTRELRLQVSRELLLELRSIFGASNVRVLLDT